MNSKQTMEDTIVVPFGTKVRSKVKLFEGFICGDLLFRDVLVCGVCESWSNRSEMCICMSNCLWSWHIWTSRGRSHMFVAWLQWNIPSFLNFKPPCSFYVHYIKPLDVSSIAIYYITFTIRPWSKHSGYQKDFQNCEKSSVDFITFVTAFLNCFNFKK